MASSSSTPSSEGTQGHIEGLLQRPPDLNSLSQQLSLCSAAAVYRRLPLGNRRLVCAACCRLTFGCDKLLFRNGVWFQKIVTQQPLPVVDFGLFKLSARKACGVSNAWACVPLIGRCTLLLASSPRALSCVYVLISFVAESCGVSRIIRCTVVFDKSLLRIYLFVNELCCTVKMSDIADVDAPKDPVVAGEDSVGGGPPGVPCTPGQRIIVPQWEGNRFLPLPRPSGPPLGTSSSPP